MAEERAEAHEERHEGEHREEHHEAHGEGKAPAKGGKAKKFFDNHKLAIISVLVGIAGIVLFLVFRSKSSASSGTGTTGNPAGTGPGSIPGGGGGPPGTDWPGTIVPGSTGASGPGAYPGAPMAPGAPGTAGAVSLPAAQNPSGPKAAANTPGPAKPGSPAMIANQIINAESQTGQGQNVVSSLEAGAINPRGITASPQQLAQASNAALAAAAQGGTPPVSAAQAEANPYSAGFVNVGGEWVPLNNPTSAQTIAATNNPNFGSQAHASPSSPAGRVPGGTIPQTPQYGAYRSHTKAATRTVRHTATRRNPGHPSAPRTTVGHNRLT